MTSKVVKNVIETAIPVIWSDIHYINQKDYVGGSRPPKDYDEFIRTRFPGSLIRRDEFGGTSDDGESGDNLYEENSAFRLDLFVRIHARTGAGTTPPSPIITQDRLDDLKELAQTKFLGKTFSNVEIFGMQDGLGPPDDTEAGWWADSISFQFHYEHFGP